jgi:hypothetical protein
MGKKEIYEVLIQTVDGVFVLPITAEGRIYVEGEYFKAKDLTPGQKVTMIASCWQKYAKPAQCNHDKEQNKIFKNSTRKSQKCSALQMRMQRESEVVPVQKEIQNVFVQPSPESTYSNDYSKTRANYQRDNIGRRKYRLYKKQNNKGTYRKSKVTASARTKTVSIPIMASAGIGSNNIVKNSSYGEQGVWENNLRFFNIITQTNLQNRSRSLLSEKTNKQELLRKTNRFKPINLVDGRWVSKWGFINPFFFFRGTQNNNRLVLRKVQNNPQNFMGQTCKSSVFNDQSALPFKAKRNNQTTLDSINGIQTGTILEIKKTGLYTETYDIGVNKVQNFFADGVLVHNCQHDASKSASILHDAIRPDYVVGLTATPYRTDNAQLCFQKVIKDAGIHQLIREGYLAEFNQWIIDSEWTPENICETYVEQPEKWGKSVIYFLTKENARACAKLLNDHGISTACVTGDSPRENTLQAFEDGVLKVLTNVAVLMEGFDCPNLKTVFVRPSSRGPTVQMAGRAFRKFPGLPVVNVVQSEDTRFPFTRHARPMDQFVKTNGKWRSISLKNLSNIFIEQTKKIANAEVDIPKFILDQSKNRNLFGDLYND